MNCQSVNLGVGCFMIERSRARAARWSLAVATMCCLLGMVALLAAAFQDANRGKAAFERICSSCHGVEGAGGVGPRLVPFTKTDRELLTMVREGNGQMPPLAAIDISDEDVIAAAAYLRSLSAKPEPDSASASNGPVRSRCNPEQSHAEWPGAGSSALAIEGDRKRLQIRPSRSVRQYP